MKTTRLYRMVWEYREGWNVNTSEGGPESVQFSYVEGVVSDGITGRLRGVNHSRRRNDGAYLPDAHGVIEGSEGVIVFDYRGIGAPHVNRRTRRASKLILAAEHHTEASAYSALNEGPALGIGEGRLTTDNRLVVVLDVVAIDWRSITGFSTARPDLPATIAIGEKSFPPELLS